MTTTNQNNLEELLRSIDLKLNQLIVANNENRAILNRLAEGMKPAARESSSPAVTDESGNLKKLLDEDIQRLKIEIEGAEKIDLELKKELAATGDDTETRKLTVLLRSNRENLKELQSRYDYTLREKTDLETSSSSGRKVKVTAEMREIKYYITALVDELTVERAKRAGETNKTICKAHDAKIARMSKELEGLQAKYADLESKQN